MKKILPFYFLFCFGSSAFANNKDILGVWRGIDDKTGFTKGVVEITKDKNGVYTGTIIEIVPRPGYTPKTICTGCPPPYANQPLLGMQVITNMKPDPKNPNEFSGGTVLDPVSGKLYKSRLKLSSSGDRLTVRGFVGIEVIGRSQIWIRKKD